MTRIILASKSYGRRQMLEGAGLVFECIPASIDERTIEEKLQQIESKNTDIALELAKEKSPIGFAAPFQCSIMNHL